MGMSAFTAAEIAYMQSQRIGRMATIGPDGQPHVVPVGFRYNPEEDSIDLGGRAGLTQRKYYRDLTGNPKVAFVIDDVPSFNPWTIRGVEIRGEAEVRTTGGQTIQPFFGPEMIRIHPKRVVSWGLANEAAPKPE